MNDNEKNLNIALKVLHKELVEIQDSIEYRTVNKICKNRFIKKAITILFNLKDSLFGKKLPRSEGYKIVKNDIEDEDYSNLENKKIAIYTCITGDYDVVREPLYCNKNIDYILFTNNTRITSQKWKIKVLKDLNDYDNVLLNRYVKMHPHEFLSNYDYSIYIDGSVKICADISSFINKINSKYGIALSKHSMRDDCQDELLACQIRKKGNIKRMQLIVKNYYNEGFPKHYGLLEATVIATDLNNILSKKILDNWWKEFYDSKVYRDQISLPYVLWKMKIFPDEIGTLSNDINHDLKIDSAGHWTKG